MRSRRQPPAGSLRPPPAPSILHCKSCRWTRLGNEKRQQTQEQTPQKQRVPADVLAAQVSGCPCSCLQVDEANIPGNPSDGPLAAEAINKVLDAFDGPTAVHFCFGNYGGQTIQAGKWKPLLEFLDSLHADHLVLELAHRPKDDLEAIKDLDGKTGIGLGVVDIKVNEVETAEDIARSIEEAEKVIGPGRVRYVHPDCGFWMLKRSVADRKIAALAIGRDLFLGR